MSADPSGFIDVATAARHYGVSAKTIRRRIAEGALPAVRVGRLIRIDPDDLDAMARPIPSAAGGPR